MSSVKATADRLQRAVAYSRKHHTWTARAREGSIHAGAPAPLLARNMSDWAAVGGLGPLGERLYTYCSLQPPGPRTRVSRTTSQ